MYIIQADTGGMIEIALKLAKTYHKDQVDKAGDPYIYHVCRVGTLAGMKGKTAEESSRLIAIGLLHDILEDTELSEEDLRRLHPDSVVCDTVVILTRKKDETYADYIWRLKPDRLATIVKLADLEDHLRSTNRFILPESLSKRYRKARETLLSGLEEFRRPQKLNVSKFSDEAGEHQQTVPLR
jgi:(p)ppGpp synthase/HD superfamily hydrolase